MLYGSFKPHLFRTYRAQMTHLSRTYHALNALLGGGRSSRFREDAPGIIYYVYNTREMQKEQKKCTVKSGIFEYKSKKMQKKKQNICTIQKKVVILRRILREYARVFMERNGKIGFYY